MTNPIRIALPALLLLAGLTGCDRGETRDERDQAAGRILPGSVSDAMIETDRSQVEPQLAGPSADEDGAVDGGEPLGEGTGEAPSTRRAGGSTETKRPVSPASPTPAPAPE